MNWWGWLIIGFVLMGAELTAVDAAFYLIFVGAAAILMGALGLVRSRRKSFRRLMHEADKQILFEVEMRLVQRRTVEIAVAARHAAGIDRLEGPRPRRGLHPLEQMPVVPRLCAQHESHVQRP